MRKLLSSIFIGGGLFVLLFFLYFGWLSYGPYLPPQCHVEGFVCRYYTFEEGTIRFRLSSSKPMAFSEVRVLDASKEKSFDSEIFCILDGGYVEPDLWKEYECNLDTTKLVFAKQPTTHLIWPFFSFKTYEETDMVKVYLGVKTESEEIVGHLYAPPTKQST